MLVFVCVCVFFFLFSFFLMAQNRLSVKTQTQEGVSSANKLSVSRGIYYLLLAFIVHFFSFANLLVVDLSFFLFEMCYVKSVLT